MGNRESWTVCLNLLKNLGATSVGVEVGVYGGDWSDFILGHTSIGKIYQLDPYKNFPDGEYNDHMNTVDLEQVFREAKRKLVKYGERHEFLRGISEEFINKFENESLDFVYIDGNHMFEAAKRDFELWYPKVKKGGFVIGDDFTDGITKKLPEGGYVNVLVPHQLKLEGLEKIKFLRALSNSEEYRNFKIHGEYGVEAAVVEFCRERKITYEYLGHNQVVIYK